MIQEVHCTKVAGIIVASPSKSHAQRAIAIAGLTHGESRILNYGTSLDVNAVVQVIRDFGARVEQFDEELIVSGGLVYPQTPVNCKESGLGFRMFSAIAATFDKPITLTGEGTLVGRSMEMVVNSLESLNVVCRSNQGKLPLEITGPVCGSGFCVDGSQSSQFISGLLMAAPIFPNGLNITVDNLQSKLYVDLTIETMKQFGVNVLNEDYRKFFVSEGQKYRSANVSIEGDWSGVAFLLVAGALYGTVRVERVSPFSTQPDKNILTVLMNVGAKVSIGADYIEVAKGELNPFYFDATDCPDLIPPLVALAAHCKGDSLIRGAKRLYNKESNRALTLQQEFQKMGITLLISDDAIIVYGAPVHGANVESHGDHRIAMACAIAGLASNEIVRIHDSEVVAKSYPAFFEDLKNICVD